MGAIKIYSNDAPVSTANPLPVTGIITDVVTDVLVGPVDETAPATDTASSGLNGRLQRVAQRITSFIALLPASIGAKAKAAAFAIAFATDQIGVAGAPSADFLSVQGVGYTGTFTVTRAANQTPYTAGDVVGGALTLATVGPAAGEVLINAIRIMLNITALPAGMTTFTLHLFDVTPPSAIADNSPFTLGSGDRAAYLGKITGIQAAAEGVGTQSVVARLENIAQQFKIASGAQLFAYLVTDAAFTPAANSETYTGKVKTIGV